MSVNGCWNCGSPLHHRPACPENVPAHEAAETRRELKRYQDALRPTEAFSASFPTNISVKYLDALMNNSDQFYYDINAELDEVGRPPIQQNQCQEFHLKQKNINLQLYMFRKQDDKMFGSLKKGLRCHFFSDDEWKLFLAKVETVSERRDLVWAKSSRLLVWAKMAIQLARQLASLQVELTDWAAAKIEAVVGRPDIALLQSIVESEVPTKLKSVAEISSVIRELRRICNVDNAQDLELLEASVTASVYDTIQRIQRIKADVEQQVALEKARVELEGLQLDEINSLEREAKRLQDENDELDKMVKCGICLENNKEMVLPCSHMWCEACIKHLEDHSGGNEVAVPGGQGMDGEQLYYFEQPTKEQCPLCEGPLTPRRAVFF